MEMGTELKECRKYLRKKDDHIAWFDGWKGDTYQLEYINLKLVKILQLIVRGARWDVSEHNVMTWQEFNDRFMKGNCLRLVNNM